MHRLFILAVILLVGLFAAAGLWPLAILATVLVAACGIVEGHDALLPIVEQQQAALTDSRRQRWTAETDRDRAIAIVDEVERLHPGATTTAALIIDFRADHGYSRDQNRPSTWQTPPAR